MRRPASPNPCGRGLPGVGTVKAHPDAADDAEVRTRLLVTGLALTSILSAVTAMTVAPLAAAADTVIQDNATAVERARGPGFTDEQRRVARLVNDTRSGLGKRRLTLNATLTRKAQRWAEHLAAINALEHSDLTNGVPSNWRALGENVGYASTIREVHQAFISSAGHRHNILGRWNAIGTGYAADNGRVFVVHVFMRT